LTEKKPVVPLAAGLYGARKTGKIIVRIDGNGGLVKSPDHRVEIKQGGK